MTTLDPETDLDTLSGELTRLVRAVDGVTAVYSSKPLMKTAVAVMVEKIKHDSVGIHLVSLVPGTTGTDVIATIGVGDDEPARVVCERVYSALNDYFRHNAFHGSVAIRVKVGRVG